jgi:hypothetical protein
MASIKKDWAKWKVENGYADIANNGIVVEKHVSLLETGEATYNYYHALASKADVNGYSVKSIIENHYAISSNVSEEDLNLEMADLIRKYGVDESVKGFIVVDDARAFMERNEYKKMDVESFIAYATPKAYISKNGNKWMLKCGKTNR